MHFTDTAAENVCVLTIDINESSVDQTVTGNHAVRSLPGRCSVKIRSSGLDHCTDLNKAVCVEQR